MIGAIMLMTLPLLIVVLLSGTCWLLAWLSGWRPLARDYRASAAGPANEISFAWQSARIGWIDYNGCINVHVSAEGVRLAMFFMFRPGHRSFSPGRAGTCSRCARANGSAFSRWPSGTRSQPSFACPATSSKRPEV